MKNLLVSAALYICCFMFIGFVPDHVYANSKSVDQFAKALNSFEVDGLSFGMKEPEMKSILVSKGYKQKKKKKKKGFVVFSYVKKKDKKNYSVVLKKPTDNNDIQTLKFTFPNVGGQAFIDEEMKRIIKVFGEFRNKDCILGRGLIKCNRYTDTNVLAIDVKITHRSIHYVFKNMPSYQATERAKQRAHAAGHKKHEKVRAKEQKQKEIDNAVAAKAQQEERLKVREAREARREASHQRMLEENRQLFEKRKKAVAVLAEQEKQEEEKFHRAYYEITPEREKSKYSDNERNMMRDGKLVVTAEYAAPSPEEIRLAVMRSMVDRADAMSGKFRSDRVRSRNRRDSVMTDGRKIYLIVDSTGTGIEFRDVKDVSCSRRAGHSDYMCQYVLGSSASNGGSNSFAREIEKLLSYSGSTKNSDWFKLTETGWRQPHTDEQLAALKKNDERAGRLVRERKARRYDNVSMLDRAAQELGDGMYIQGVELGATLMKLR